MFGSSLEVMISVFGENPAEGAVRHCADAFATLVMVGPEGGPRRCPFQLRPRSELEVLRWVVGWVLLSGGWRCSGGWWGWCGSVVAGGAQVGGGVGAAQWWLRP